MGEFFELSFFSKEHSMLRDLKHHFICEPRLSSIVNRVCMQNISVFGDHSTIFEWYKESMYVYYMLSIEDLQFTPKNYQNVLSDILNLVNECFYLVPEIEFATGIYELTYHYIAHTHTLRDVRDKLFPHCPFVFLRASELELFPNANKYKEIIYLTQSGRDVQQII